MQDNFLVKVNDGRNSQTIEEKYIDDVRRRVARAFFPPRDAVRTHFAIATFKVDRDGKPVEFRFVRRSRDIAYDEAIRKAINTNDFRPRQKPHFLKAEFKANKLTIFALPFPYINRESK